MTDTDEDESSVAVITVVKTSVVYAADIDSEVVGVTVMTTYVTIRGRGRG